MVILLNLRIRIIFPILFAGLVLIAWACPSYAAQLKDIRVGEYETHTRIVFEFSDTIASETIRPLASWQLSVVFPDTDLDLVRKIPMDRSKYLKNIKIWQRKNELSLVLTFTFEHFRYELSKMDQPIRLLLDIYRLTTPEGSSLPVAEKTATPALSAKAEENPDAQPPAQRLETGPADKYKPALSAEADPSAIDRNAGSIERPPTQLNENDISPQITTPQKPPVSDEPTRSVQAPATKLEPPKQARTPVPPPKPAPQPRRLQYYLVIGLIILTLVILVLLLIMLVLKSHWVNSSSPIKPGELLERQDKRIAALDAKIQEQLNRFDGV
jgi:hypothetical protein